MTTVTDPQVHGEHRQRQTDVALWRCDVGFWRQEARKALADLKRLEAALLEHTRALEDHADKLATREEVLNAHAEFPADGDGQASAEGWILHVSHHHDATTHVRERDLHERIKRRHHTMMAYWSLLLDILDRRP